jgi:hypothetical protein
MDTPKEQSEKVEVIPRKAITCDFSLAMNINSCVAQA